jgi:mono/diheme cytochrome c family protein
MHPRISLILAVVGTLCAAGSPVHADQAPAQQPPSAAPGSKSTVDVPSLFANVCGFCHNDGGRKAGRGPQLMGTTRSDDFIRYRIKHGKEGAMPAFPQLSDADIDAIIAYIRNLKPEQT